MSIIDTFDSKSQEIILAKQTISSIENFPKKVIAVFTENFVDYVIKTYSPKIITTLKACSLVPVYSLDYNGEEIVNFVAQADPHDLVNQIEHEWFNDYKLLKRNMYDPDAFLPQDLYVFDFSMKWCVAFTHETDPVYPESRYCILCTLED